jgi:hypothetical protein
MDIHAPHEPIHTARDFFLHLFTITVGLLIALALEGLVELHHHHELLHTAETNLRQELAANRSALAKDRRKLAQSEQAFNDNLAILLAVRNHQPPAHDLTFNWFWNGAQSAAWDAAHNTGAIALMSYDHAQNYSSLYLQQQLVDDQATLYIRDIYRAAIPLEGNRTLASLQPAELDAMIANTQQTLVDIKLLNDFASSLDRLYTNTEGNL